MSATTSSRRAALAAMAALATVLVAPGALAARPPSEGAAAPALAGRGFDGQDYSLEAWRGQVVVLNIWASWCDPCRAEMPLLDALQRDYRSRGVVVLGLSADDRHDRGDALKAAASVGYLTGMLSDSTVNGFGAPAVLPLTYVIDRHGMVAAVLRADRGALGAQQLRDAVERALGE